MDSCDNDNKARRAVSRQRHIATKRSQFQQRSGNDSEGKKARGGSRARSASAGSGHGTTPARMARAASRTLLAKGCIESSADMPTINGVEPGVSCTSGKKPRAASLIRYSGETETHLGFANDSDRYCPIGSSCENEARSKSPTSVADYIGMAVSLSGVKASTHLAQSNKVAAAAKVREASVDSAASFVSMENVAHCEAAHAAAAWDGGACSACSGEELDIVGLKHKRAVSRRRHIEAKREQYSHSAFVPRTRRSRSTSQERAKPHRMARAAARTMCSRGSLEVAGDMPQLTSMGRSTEAQGWRKPSVSGCIRHSPMELLKQVTRTEGFENMKTDTLEQWVNLALRLRSSQAEEEAATTASSQSPRQVESSTDSEVQPSDSEKVVEVVESPVGEEPSKSAAGKKKVLVSKKQVSKPAAAEPAAEPAEPIVSLGQASTAATTDSDEVSPCEASKREAVLRSLVQCLRDQVVEAEAQAAEAKKVPVQESAAQPAEEKKSTSVAVGAPKATGRKLALQLEKKRSVELRKKKQMEEQMKQLQEKADKALKAAQQERDEAEAESLAKQARYLADASQAAQAEAEARAAAEVELMMEARLEELASQEAEAKAAVEAELKAAREEAEAAALKAKAAAADLQAQAEREIQALKHRAEVEAGVTKARAQMEANELRQQLEAERRSVQEAEEQRKADLEAQKRDAEKKAQQEAREAVKLGKQLQQNRSKQFKKQAAAEKQQEVQKQKEVDAVREKAEEEARLARAKAFEQAAEIKARALQEAEALKAKALAEVESKAQARALQEAEALKAKASVTEADGTEEKNSVAPRTAPLAVEEPVAVAAAARVAEKKELEAECDCEWEVLPNCGGSPVGARGALGWSILG